MRKAGLAVVVLTLALALSEAFCLSRVSGDEPGFVPRAKPSKPVTPAAEEFFAPAPVPAKPDARPAAVAPHAEPAKPEVVKPEAAKPEPHTDRQVNAPPRPVASGNANEAPAAPPRQSAPSVHYVKDDVQYILPSPVHRARSAIASWVPVDALAVAVLKMEALIKVPEFALIMQAAMTPKLWELTNTLDRFTVIVMATPEDFESTLEVTTLVLHAREDQSFEAITDFLPPEGPTKKFAGQTYLTSSGLSWFQPDAKTLVLAREAVLLRLILNGPNSKARMVTTPRWQEAAEADLAIAINPARLGKLLAPDYSLPPTTAHIEEFTVPNVSQTQYAQAPAAPPEPQPHRASHPLFAYPELLSYLVHSRDIQIGVNLRGSQLQVLTGLETPVIDEAEMNNSRLVDVAWASLEAYRNEARTNSKDVVQQAIQIALLNVVEELTQSSTCHKQSLGAEVLEFHWTAATEVNPRLLEAVTEMVAKVFVFVPAPPADVKPDGKREPAPEAGVDKTEPPAPRTRAVPNPVNAPEELESKHPPVESPREQPAAESDPKPAEPEPAAPTPEAADPTPAAPPTPPKAAGRLGDD